MVDAYKEVTNASWGSRIVGSFMGVIFGLLFFIGSFPLIFWNEGRSVDRIKTLDEGRNLVVAVAPEPVDPSHKGALIHLSGLATTQEMLKDAPFGVQENALKLKRTVEMYQWEERKETKTTQNLGGSETTETTYSYDKTWAEGRIDSSNFKKREGHENPPLPYKSETTTASTISIGAFRLTKPFVEQIDSFENYPLSQEHFDAMGSRLKQSFVLSDSTYFRGDPANPQIGALRISYGIIKPTELSVVGKQDEHSIQTFTTKNGTIHLLATGAVSAETMFAAAETENKVMTWLIRLGAFLLMWMGLTMILGPIKTLGDVVPFIGGLLGAGIGAITCVVALVLSMIAMALAWIVFRPVIGVSLLVVAVALCFGGVGMLRKKAAAAA